MKRTGTIIGTIVSQGENFTCNIRQSADGCVYFRADGDIDADGANGQYGGPAAYRVDDKGTEALANGGMARNSAGKVYCKHDWARHIVILGKDNQPKVFPGGVIASMTWYRHPGMDVDDPQAYVDSESIPYIVVPPLVIQRAKGIVCGCRARVSYKGTFVECVVADRGPRKKIGELSIAAARVLGIRSSPRNGGLSAPEIFYELWPGQEALISASKPGTLSVPFVLLPS